MTKAEKEILEKILVALDKTCELLEKLANPPMVVANDLSIAVEPEPVEAVAPAKESTETDSPTGQKLDLEYMRKAFHAIGTKLTKDERKIFLAQFGGAKTIPKLDEKYYSAFIDKAADIMKGD